MPDGRGEVLGVPRHQADVEHWVVARPKHPDNKELLVLEHQALPLLPALEGPTKPVVQHLLVPEGKVSLWQ